MNRDRVPSENLSIRRESNWRWRINYVLNDAINDYLRKFSDVIFYFILSFK